MRRPPRPRDVRRARRRAAAGPLAVLLGAAVLGGACSGDRPATPAAAPATAAAPVPTTVAAPPPSLAGTRVLSPARRFFAVNVPARFVDIAAETPEAAAVAPLQQALRSGVGVLAVDRESAAASGSGYSPTAGGFCTRTTSQDLPQLGEELRRGAINTGTTAAPPRVEVLAALPPIAGPRVTVAYPGTFSGRALRVLQVAGLAGPGRACVLTYSTDDETRDAKVLTTVRDSFRITTS